MTPTQAGALFRIARAGLPHQKFDEYTPDLWAELFADVPFEDARTALVDMVKRQAFVSAGEIISEVKRIRTRRIEQHPIIPPPDMDPDDVPRYLTWKAQATRAVADGKVPEPVGALVSRDMKQLESTFKEPE
jgi:hypothetical protein